jgi:hypothetical protein
MNKKLDDEASKLTSKIVEDLSEKDGRMHKLKKLKDDITEILELRDLHD